MDSHFAGERMKEFYFLLCIPLFPMHSDLYENHHNFETMISYSIPSNKFEIEDALAFAEENSILIECIQESPLGLGEVPAVITAIAVGTQQQFQAFLSNVRDFHWRPDCGSKKLSNQALFAIAEALKSNTAMHTFCFIGNHISDQSAIAIAEMLKVSTTAECVYLCGNHISDQGAMAIAEALKINQTIYGLLLWENEISDEGAIAIAEALKVNSTLIDVNYGDCRRVKTKQNCVCQSLQKSDI